jgi:hypothetical protein
MEIQRISPSCKTKIFNELVCYALCYWLNHYYLKSYKIFQYLKICGLDILCASCVLVAILFPLDCFTLSDVTKKHCCLIGILVRFMEKESNSEVTTETKSHISRNKSLSGNSRFACIALGSH